MRRDHRLRARALRALQARFDRWEAGQLAHDASRLTTEQVAQVMIDIRQAIEALRENVAP